MLLAAVLTGCKKDDDDPPPSSGGGGTVTETAQVRFTIDGDGASDQDVTINAVSGSGLAAYSTTDNETAGSILANAQNQFQLVFDGNATATLTCTGGVGQLGIGLRFNDQQYISQNNTVTITEYGAVGGWVRGSFSGTVLRANGASPGTVATISGGTFKFKRTSDV
jgi:hypothetical protein